MSDAKNLSENLMDGEQFISRRWRSPDVLDYPIRARQIREISRPDDVVEANLNSAALPNSSHRTTMVAE